MLSSERQEARLKFNRRHSTMVRVSRVSRVMVMVRLVGLGLAEG